MSGYVHDRRSAYNHLMNAINNAEDALAYLGQEGSQDWRLYCNLLGHQQDLVGLLIRMEVEFGWKTWDGSLTVTQTCCMPPENAQCATSTPTSRTNG